MPLTSKPLGLTTDDIPIKTEVTLEKEKAKVIEVEEQIQKVSEQKSDSGAGAPAASLGQADAPRVPPSSQ